MNEKNQWRIFFPQTKVFKNKTMGWVFSEGRSYAHNFSFNSLEDAVAYCKHNAMDFDIEYPKYKNFEYKSYANNFMWKGPEVESENVDYE
jgi:hypothetical protein